MTVIFFYRTQLFTLHRYRDITTLFIAHVGDCEFEEILQLEGLL